MSKEFTDENGIVYRAIDLKAFDSEMSDKMLLVYSLVKKESQPSEEPTSDWKKGYDKRRIDEETSFKNMVHKDDINKMLDSKPHEEAFFTKSEIRNYLGATEEPCICKRDEITGLRMDVICPKHDEAAEVGVVPEHAKGENTKMTEGLKEPYRGAKPTAVILEIERWLLRWKFDKEFMPLKAIEVARNIAEALGLVTAPITGEHDALQGASQEPTEGEKHDSIEKCMCVQCIKRRRES